MRKLMALAIVILFAGATSTWAFFGLENVNFDGSLEVSGNSANNEVNRNSANDNRGGTNTRVRVGANLEVTEGVNGRLELTRTGRRYGTAATTVAGEEALWNVQNAYIDIVELWGLDLFRVGRQYVGEAGDLVWNISPTDDDSLSVSAIDGLTVNNGFFDNALNINIFTGKANEDDALANTDTDDVSGDVNLTAVDVHLNVVPNGRVNVGYLSGDDKNTSARSDDNKLRTARVGVRGSVAENMVSYRAEFFQNMGSFNGAGRTGAGAATELDYKGNAIDVGLALNIDGGDNVGQFGVGANLLLASGDDDVTDDTDDSFHDFSPLGFNTSDRLIGEIFGKSNTLGGGSPIGQGINTADATGSAPSGLTQGQGMQVIHFFASYDPSWWEKAGFNVDVYLLSRAEDTVKTGAATNAQVGDKFGTEIDLTLNYKQSENISAEFGYAMLNPDDAITGVNSTSDDAITKLFARGKIAWGGSAE